MNVADEINYLKSTQAYMRFGQYGHWYNDHYHRGALKPHACLYDGPIHNQHAQARQADKSPNHQHYPDLPDSDETVSFNMAHTNIPPSTDANSKSPNDGPVQSDITHPAATPPSTEPAVLGPMFDTGAPYSAIRFSELCALTSSMTPTWIGELGPLPAQLVAN